MFMIGLILCVFLKEKEIFLCTCIHIYWVEIRPFYYLQILVLGLGGCFLKSL